MKEKGWVGDGILVAEGANGLEAGTGTHRIAAAKIAGLETVPTYVMDKQKVEEWCADNDKVTADIFSGDDEEKVATLESIGDQYAVNLMKAEVFRNTKSIRQVRIVKLLQKHNPVVRLSIEDMVKEKVKFVLDMKTGKV
jgi:hypothetical protein